MNIALDQLGSPLRITPPEPLSVEQFFQFSSDNGDLRMEREPNGDLIIMTPAFGGTGFRGAQIGLALGRWAEEDKRGYALDSSAGCLLPDGSIRSADAAWILGSRWSPPSIENDAPVPCPDFVIELRSKTDRLAPLQKKMQAWIANGAQLGWLIDPHRKTVEIYRPGMAAEEQEGHSAVYGETPVGGFVLELGKIWG